MFLGNNISDIATGLTHPIITETLQIAYFLFFPAMIFQGIILYRNHTHNDFDLFIRNIIFAFYLSYIGYILFPAIGPRFMVGDFSTLYDSLPGLYFTDYIRHIIDSGGGISDPSLAISQVNKDCMPSGHTMMSIVNIWFAYRFNIKYKHLIGVITFLIIFSTLYLQYHYLVDVIAGIFAAFLSLWLEPYIARIISSKR
jgi:membrane-associated phospholipid phosphatase